VLHGALKREFGPAAIGSFPAKTLLYVKKEESTRRRILLQQFLQTVSRNPAILEGTTFLEFLNEAKKNSQKFSGNSVEIEIFLPNGKSLLVDIGSTNNSNEVLEAVFLAPFPTFLSCGDQ
jgi:sorting nexin-17